MTEKLDIAIANYKVINAIAKKAQALTLQDKKYVAEFNLPILGKKFTDYKNDINTYFDSLTDIVLEYAFLELFASFEATVIEKIRLASGEIIKVAEENYENHLPFVGYQERFVKNENDLGSLNKILDLLENKISPELHLELKTIVKYRDKLAHGKRFHEDVILSSIEDTYSVMTKILEEL